VLAAGAPLGLLLMRRFLLRDRTPIRESVRRDVATYAYLTTSTSLVFTVLGRALGRQTERLAQLSTTDSLTGLFNRRTFHARLEQEIERSRRSRSPLSLLVLDLDHLKALNDRHGHHVGDRALAALARAIHVEMRSIDVGARLGGDEFALLAVGADQSSARTIADRLRSAIERQTMVEPISASIGVVTFDPSRDQFEDVSTFTRAADQALYVAKRAGRNRVAVGALDLRRGG
jgi:diguanylate cyclase (GGDEF)-like protein